MNDIAEWVSSAKNQTEKNFRSVVHIILSAISSHHDLQPEMMMKGGILMAIAYHTGRYTKDVDFSTPKHYREFQNGQDAFIANLSNAIKTAGLTRRFTKVASRPSASRGKASTGNADRHSDAQPPVDRIAFHLWMVAVQRHCVHA